MNVWWWCKKGKNQTDMVTTVFDRALAVSCIQDNLQVWTMTALSHASHPAPPDSVQSSVSAPHHSRCWWQDPRSWLHEHGVQSSVYHTRTSCQQLVRCYNGNICLYLKGGGRAELVLTSEIVLSIRASVERDGEMFLRIIFLMFLWGKDLMTLIVSVNSPVSPEDMSLQILNHQFL